MCRFDVFLVCLFFLSITDCSFPRCRLVPRLVRASRGASRLFYPVVSLLARIVLISSRAASRRTSRFPVSSCLLVSFLRICVSRVASRPIPVSPFLRLVISSCWYVVLARLVFLFIRLIVLRVLDEMFLRGGVFPYQSDRYAARFLRLVSCGSFSPCLPAAWP